MKPPVTRSEAGTYTAQQPVKLERGLYGAMFRGYTEPKPYPKYQSSETEDKISLRFLVTHAANETPLARLSSASAFATLKWFYDPIGRKMSRYFEFHAAILAGKHTADELAAMKDDDLPDLDTLIGWPVALMIEPSLKPDKHGIVYNNIAAILAPSPGMKKAITVIYKTAETSYDDRGLRYLSSPVPQYEELVGAAVASSNGQTVDDDETVPF